MYRLFGSKITSFLNAAIGISRLICQYLYLFEIFFVKDSPVKEGKNKVLSLPIFSSKRSNTHLRNFSDYLILEVNFFDKRPYTAIQNYYFIFLSDHLI